MFLHKTNILMECLYPNLVWKIADSSKTIYLTFDDGPIPEITEFVLETLEQYQAKASFFVIGNNVLQNPKIFDKILANGHSVGNHTMSHPNGWKTDYEAYMKNIADCQVLLPKQKYFRPPYGRITQKQAKAVLQSQQIAMWSVLSGDFSKDISPEKCLKKTTQYSKPGSIVLFHDSQKASKNMMHTLPRYIAHFKELGYNFAALP
jgi:peptidoglycan-N-acetylglucosamine deacetylase